MTLRIRAEAEGDYPRITEVNDLAFGQESEGHLVEKLRRTPEFLPGLSLVAEVNGRVVGHILFHPVTIESKAASHPSLALAPMSVVPEYQNQEIGSRLVREGLRLAKELGHNSVIVLGHADYYPRFGFQPASRWDIRSPFDVPDESFLAMELTPGALTGIEGPVRYPAEFLEN